MTAAAPGGPESPRSAPDDRALPWRSSLVCAALLPLGWLALRMAARFPEQVESVYSRSVFPFVRAGLRRVAGLFPGHLAETLVLVLVAGLLLGLLRGVLARLRGGRSLSNLVRCALLRGLRAGGFLYAFFLVAWGFNHARRPYAVHAGLDPVPVDVRELKELLRWLVSEANGLRAELDEGDWVLREDGGGFDARLAAAYAELASEVPALTSDAPLLRRAFLAPALSRLGISGIYSPFTAEAHLNGEIEAWVQPFAAAHEAAHYKGFAREDEANFIAWQVCRRAREPGLRYSGTLVALEFTGGALDRADFFWSGVLLDGLSDAVLADLGRNREFWDARHSAVTEVAQASNDAYLKLQGQGEGRASYGRMVDLLVAEWRERPD